MEAAQQVDPQGGQEEGQEKLKVDKFADGPIVCLKFAGTVDEDFDGKKLSATVKAKTLLLDLAEVHKISSFGIREWVDFINSVSKNAEEVILLQASPKVVDQLNMVANFAGDKGKVYSFFCPYTCDYCDTSPRVLMQVDTDWDVIKSMKPPERNCEQCGEPEYFDEDPTTYFSFIAGQEPFELEYGVEAFLSTKLDYAVSDGARKLRIDKAIEGRSTYVKLAGDLDGSFPKEKLAEGLEGTIVLDVSGVGRIDPAGAAEWRGCVQMMTPGAEVIYLEGVSPAFLEKLTGPEDLGAKGRVISFFMPYQCEKCGMTQSHSIDVEEHHEVLKFATPPEMKCSDCKGAATCVASENMLSFLPKLPPIEVPAPVRKFIKEMKARKPEKKKQSTTVAEAAAAQGRAAGLGTMLAGGFIAAALSIGGLFGWNYYQENQRKAEFAKYTEVGKMLQSSAEARPAWIESDTQFSSKCTDDANGLACYGVSSYVESQADAQVEAEEAALEALIHGVGLKIEDEAWVANVRELYSQARAAKLEKFKTAASEKNKEKYDQAKRDVRSARTGVVNALKESGGSSDIPAQPSDEYWEQFDALGGRSSKYQVFVQYRLDTAQVARLIDRYSKTASAEGATVVTAFPSISWRYPDITTGAVLTKVSAGKVQAFGLAPGFIVTNVQGKVVATAADFEKFVIETFEYLNEKGGNAQFKVKTGDTMLVDYNQPVKAEVKIIKSTGGTTKPTTRPGVNIWEATKGGGGGGGMWE